MTTNHSPDLILLDDGTLLDPDTGEVIEEGAELPTFPSDRAAWLAVQFNEAKQQAAAWELKRKALSRAVLGLTDVKTFEAEGLKFTAVGSRTGKSARAENVLKAVEAELLTHEAASQLLIVAARDLDAKAVEEWIQQFGVCPDGDECQDAEVHTPPEELSKQQKALRALLINEYPVAGHMRAAPVLKDATRNVVSREAVA